MNTKTVKLFDSNNNLVPNFDEEIERILISIHGEDYYDVDEALVNTNLIPVQSVTNDVYKEDELEKTMEIVGSMISKDSPKISIVEKKKERIGIKDFIPLFFFILIFSIIVIAGYYFLNTIDFTSLLK